MLLQIFNLPNGFSVKKCVNQFEFLLRITFYSLSNFAIMKFYDFETFSHHLVYYKALDKIISQVFLLSEVYGYYIFLFKIIKTYHIPFKMIGQKKNFKEEHKIFASI